MLSLEAQMHPFPYTDAETQLSGHLYRPSAAPRAAVLVLPTIMNPTPSVHAKAEALADAGYLALVADLYGTQPGSMDEARTLAMALRADPTLTASAYAPHSGPSPRCPKRATCPFSPSDFAWAGRPHSNSRELPRRSKRS